MQVNFFDKFSLSHEKEASATVLANIGSGVVFRGTNLWILIFAIIVASLGLNLNSPAVIIGAMLISPLMGPIMGIGLGVAITDIALLRRAIYNYFIAAIVALVTSTIFFLISPLNAAHSEILARTSPTVYDVLIAFAGGLAGIVATSSKLKGNVIPGVAIATALMPPLCTAGYGLATFHFSFFFGALYLFIINSVFIALATFIIVRLLHFPHKHQQNKRSETIAHRIVWLVVIVTLLPSLYFGYDMVQRDKFTKNANAFINTEVHFPNDYLLNKKIDAKQRSITLVFGGKEISAAEISQLKNEMKKYGLENSVLDVKQGFSYLAEDDMEEKSDQLNNLSEILKVSEKRKDSLQTIIDSTHKWQALEVQIYKELKAQYPVINAAIQPVLTVTDSSLISSYLAVMSFSKRLSQADKKKIGNWLKVRLQQNNVTLIFK
ncbi:MAG: TIGR00341 family protein [Sediminibacterium sp.]